MSTLPRLDKTLRPQPDLPEKAIQFGTGAFLRGFIDYFLDQANARNAFGGRVVAIGSTGSGRDRLLNEQDGLYTLWVRGVENGQARSEFKQVCSVSRALSATTEWQQVLECARNPNIEYIFSNTTETGIVLDENDSGMADPPRSFPGKLTRMLRERAAHFDYAPTRGVIVIPCELIEDNGTRLKQIVLTLAERWNYGSRFAAWINECVPFCNTLVDRIVPGEPARDVMEQAWQQLGYTDEMLTVCESYRLFAIEAPDAVAQRLHFTVADPNIIVTDDIAPYRLRKVRLLNGSHTIMVPLAILAGCQTVADAVRDERVGAFLRAVLLNELAPSVPADGAVMFANAVIDRFSNPYIRHELTDITLQQTMKMRVRVVPSIIDYAAKHGRAPENVALGFAAYLLFMRGDHGGPTKPDDQHNRLRDHWQNKREARDVVRAVCRDIDLWQTDLNDVPGFTDMVTGYLESLTRDGVHATLDAQSATLASTR